MVSPDDPFAAPQMLEAPPPLTAAHHGDASAGQRLANVAIDYAGIMVFGGVIGFVSGVVGSAELLDEIPDQLFGVVAMTTYYLLFEGLTGRTLGKLVTGTRVVAEDGQRPSFGKIVGRTFSRFVPFEAFSFLGGNPRGWHDQWSGTRVVRLRPPALDG